jgi:hypothetical protein
MTIDAESSKQIEEIMGGMKCPKDFACFESGFEVLCRARTIGTEQFLLCLEENPLHCKFVSVEHGYSCQCPLRLFIATKLKK